MAAGRTTAISLPILRTKILFRVAESGGRYARRFIQNDSSSSSINDGVPLLQKLLKSPVSNIKTALDSEFRSDPQEFPWAALLSSLNSSSPPKANMVIEWKLEQLEKNKVQNQSSYAQLISLCGRIRNLSIAMLVFSSMEAHGLKPSSSVFNALISSSLSSGSLLTALSLLEIMEASDDYRPDSETFDAFISAYADMGNKNLAEDWLSGKKATGFFVDARNYASIILCCVKTNNFEDAERYYEEMISAGILPDESVFRNMILMYCRLRKSDKVKEFLKSGRWRLDENTVKKIVTLYQELGLVDDLDELFTFLAESNHGLEILSLVNSSMIQMYADADRLDDIELPLERMLNLGISFSCREDVEKAICCYLRREAYDRLDVFLERIKGSYKLTRSIYDLLNAGYKRAGLSEKLNLLEEMKRDGIDMVSS